MAEGVILYRENNSSILKQKSSSSKLPEESQKINLINQQLDQATIINKISFSSFSTNLMVSVLIVFVLVFIFLIIIKKLNLFRED